MASDPEALRERVVAEQTNNALVAALFLTLTIPWLCDPPDAVATDEAFAVLVILSISFQFITLGSSICIMTEMNKLDGEGAVQVAKRLYPGPPTIGIGGFAFVFANASWIATLVAVVYASCRVYLSTFVTAFSISVGAFSCIYVFTCLALMASYAGKARNVL